MLKRIVSSSVELLCSSPLVLQNLKLSFAPKVSCTESTDVAVLLPALFLALSN